MGWELQVKKKDREKIVLSFRILNESFWNFLTTKNWRNSLFWSHFLIFWLEEFEEFHGIRYSEGEAQIHEVPDDGGDQYGFLVIHSPFDEDEEGEQEEHKKACQKGEIHPHVHDVVRWERRQRERRRSKHFLEHFLHTWLTLVLEEAKKKKSWQKNVQSEKTKTGYRISLDG